MDFSLLLTNSVIPLIVEDLSFPEAIAFSSTCTPLFRSRKSYLPPVFYTLLYPSATPSVQALLLALEYGMYFAYPQVKRVIRAIQTVIPVIYVALPPTLEYSYRSYYYLSPDDIDVTRLVYHLPLPPRSPTCKGMLVFTQPIIDSIQSVTVSDERTPSSYEIVFISASRDANKYVLLSFGGRHPDHPLSKRIGISPYRVPEIIGVWQALRYEGLTLQVLQPNVSLLT